MGSEIKALSAQEVEKSRSLHGDNRLTPPERESLWRLFLEKFEDPLIIVLLVVMLLSAGIATFEFLQIPNTPVTVFLEPTGVLIALLLATGVGFIFEVRAARAFDVLNQVNDESPVRVIRQDANGDNEVTTVPKHEVVVGDYVLVETGDEVPADGILIEAMSLSVNESTLTGEPQTYKNTGEALQRSSTILEGHGVLLVQAVGDRTEYGSVYQAAQIDSGVKTPLSRQLDQLGRLLSKLAFWVAAGILAFRLAHLFLDGDSTNNDDWLEVINYILQSIMVAVTLIAVAVPEGLPLSITLSLALSMKRMLKENNLVRKLHACETMGASTVICTDKTGTLTQNCMMLSDLELLCPRESLAAAISVNSTAWLGAEGQVLGNPTEGALLRYVQSEGFDYSVLRKEAVINRQEPFTTETKQMLTQVRKPDGTEVSYLKGAPEKVMGICELSDSERTRLSKRLTDWQNHAMRTLAFAQKTDEGPWQLQALCAIADPIRREVPEAISTCMRAGIRVIIVTGDTPGTAGEIGRQIGLLSDGNSLTLTGEEFGRYTDEQMKRDILPHLAVLSRARPMDKQRLVRLLQQMHEVVAVTGDGTNDAPALKAAHVGLSMGDGTAVAKEASDITIIDNSFSSITKAVLWGRSLYQNISRFILFQMTVNVAACFIVLVGALLGKESPLSVTQMLWVNLIMDTFAAMALSALPPETSVMNQKPRSRKAHIIDRRILMACFGCGIPMSAVLLWFWETQSHHLFFTFFVLLQFWNLFNARFFRTGRSLISDLLHGQEGRASMRRGFSGSFVGIALLILVGQILISELGGQMFGVTQPLTLSEWVWMLVATSPVLLTGELVRLILQRRTQ